MSAEVKKPTFVRVEYLTPNGWVKGHAGINLLDPQRYVERLRANNKFGRALELNEEDLTPTGVVYEPDDLPDPKDLRPTNTPIPALYATCEGCGATDHDYQWQCLI